MSTSFKVIQWTGREVILLDQRRLPTRETYLNCPDFQTVAQAITDMVVRGAPAIGITAAYGVVLGVRAAYAQPASQQLDAIQTVFDRLAQTRPTAVNLFWALDRMRKIVDSVDRTSSSGLDRIEQEALNIHREDEEMCGKMGLYGAELLPPNARVLTHCNTGALATGGSGTALAIIRAAWSAGRLQRVFADETRPFLQGSRLTAWELNADGIPVHVITDNMAADLMRRGEVDAVVVGADRITANGDVANKIGTYGLAVLCAAHEIPFIVAAPTSTVDLSLADGSLIEIEERPAREVTHVGDTQIVPDGVPVLNPAFDVTPHHLITAIVTERGIARVDYAAQLSDFCTQSMP